MSANYRHSITVVRQNRHAKLRQREAEGRPVRLGLIGAGKFGAMCLAQIPRTPGVRVVAIADLAPASAHANLACRMEPGTNRSVEPECSADGRHDLHDR